VANSPDYIEKNRSHWEAASDSYQERHAAQLEKHEGRAWGVWRIPEAQLNVLGGVNGLVVLELGCGAARWSVGLARLGARPIGLDISARQLAHARRIMDAAGFDFPLIEAGAEDVPLPDESVDVIFSDHGAFTAADPRLLVPECARLLRDGGVLAFNTASPLFDLVRDPERCGADAQLHNDYFTSERIEGADSVGFQLRYGEWIRLFRAYGFEVEDLIELRPPRHATTTFRFVELAWARRWPAENIWKVRRRR
jgi:SAM-dependent methyltransferase